MADDIGAARSTPKHHDLRPPRAAPPDDLTNTEAAARLQITYCARDSLKPNARNARTHSKNQVREIEASIRQYGWSNPILCDESMEIIAGHGRLLAAKNLGIEEVPVIVLSGLSDAQKRALRIADNKIALNSGWDTEMLQLELSELVVEWPELELGFSTGEIDKLLAVAPPLDEDAVPAVPANSVTRAGDIWKLGPHLVACGDGSDPQVMQALMGGQKADAAFLDPPYNQPPANIGNKGAIKHKAIAGAHGQLSPSEFVSFLVKGLGAAAAVTKDGGVHFVCMDHQHMDEILQAGGVVYDARLNLCIWRKSNPGMGPLYRSQHEMIYVFRVGQAAHFNAVELGKHGRNRTNVWDAPSVNTFGGSRRQDLALHPTVKPVGLVADAICDVTRRGEIVLDSYLGSGTTVLACERVGRVCRGIEIDPAYVDVAIDRYSTVTGVQAVLEETGETFDQVRARRAAEGEAG